MTTSLVTIADIGTIDDYEARRVEVRAAAMATRKLRRVAVGPFMTLSFENVETVRYQIQEMVRIERITDPEVVQAEIDAYADLLPEANSLAMTMMLELTSEAALRTWLPALVGVEHTLSLELAGVGDVPIAGDEGRSTDATTAAVHYLRVTFSPAELQAMADGAEIRVRVDHPEYRHLAVLSTEAVAALVADMAEVAG